MQAPCKWWGNSPYRASKAFPKANNGYLQSFNYIPVTPQFLSYPVWSLGFVGVFFPATSKKELLDWTIKVKHLNIGNNKT